MTLPLVPPPCPPPGARDAPPLPPHLVLFPAPLPKRTYKMAAGWCALLAALFIAVFSVIAAARSGLTGPTDLTIGLVIPLLAFATACFGLKSYDKAIDARVHVARLTPPAPPPCPPSSG